MIRSMISSLPQFLRRSIGAAALVAALIGTFAAVSPASARVWIGFGFPGFVVGPPAYYYPPPVYYPPPPYYPPPAASYAPAYAPGPAAAGQSCYAGSYVCPMDHPVAYDAACYCLGSGGARVWGRAN